MRRQSLPRRQRVTIRTYERRDAADVADVFYRSAAFGMNAKGVMI